MQIVQAWVVQGSVVLHVGQLSRKLLSSKRSLNIPYFSRVSFLIIIRKHAECGVHARHVLWVPVFIFSTGTKNCSQLLQEGDMQTTGHFLQLQSRQVQMPLLTSYLIT